MSATNAHVKTATLIALMKRLRPGRSLLIRGNHGIGKSDIAQQVAEHRAKRIKGYDLRMPGGGDKKFFVLCVRGNPDYGRNDFHDNSDGTITDRACGLIWSKADSGKGLDWEHALAWVREMNGKKHLGHDDWRLPDIKELQSLVDYTRGPDTTKSAAIDPLFTCSTITNEGGQADFPFYWSSTSHIGPRGGAAAMYVAFGRAPGWLSPSGPQGGGEKRFADVHGAGAQRSDVVVGERVVLAPLDAIVDAQVAQVDPPHSALRGRVLVHALASLSEKAAAWRLLCLL